MDGAGIQYDELSPGELAELIYRVLKEEDFRKDILHSQRQRIERLSRRNVESEIRASLTELLPEMDWAEITNQPTDV